MYDIFLRLGNNLANILRKQLLNGHRDGVHHVLAEVVFDQVLLEPVVADQFALAVADFNAGEAVGLAAVELADRVFVVVPDVFAKRGLLVEAGLLPLRAVGVAHVVGAFVPGFEDGERGSGVLHNHEARVGVGAVKAVRVVLRGLGVPGVFGHGDGVFGGDLPVVEHPFDGNVQEAEGGIGVKEDNEFVLLDVVGQRRGFDPRRVAVFKVGRLNKFVVVAMDGGIGIVVEDAARHMVDVAPVVFALLEIFGRLERPRLEVQNQNLTAERLLVAWVRGQLDVAAIGLANIRLGGRGDQGRIEGAQDVVDGSRCLFRVNGSVLDSVSPGSRDTRGLACHPSQRRQNGVDIRL
jgi:hypothetical protein